MQRKIFCVVGGQYGSEAKGHVAAQLHRRYYIQYGVRVGGPNAGHTVIDDDGRRFALRSIPVCAAVDDESTLVIAAGSELDVDVLFEEIESLESAGHPVRNRLVIDPQVTIIAPAHKDLEAGLVGKVGSTGKGIGAARAARMMRTATTAKDDPRLASFLSDTMMLLNQAHKLGSNILIEGTQGYHLGLHAGHYPQSTTNDCRAIDIVAQAGITPLTLPEIWLVLRTYPIRVAGNSGDMGTEIDWDTLSEATDGYIQPERTTVTQKIRRVAEWSSQAARMAILGNGGADNERLHLALMFADYLDPALAGHIDHRVLEGSPALEWIESVEDELGISFSMFGTGPDTVIWR